MPPLHDGVRSMTKINDHRAAVERHCALFNACVASGDWAPFVDTFTDDAELIFVGIPVGPVVGRDNLYEAYTKRPPTEPMTVREIERVGDDSVRVEYVWASGRAGEMTVGWRDDKVYRVEITA